MRRTILAFQLTAVLVAISLAGCSGVANSGGGTNPVAPTLAMQPASVTVAAGQTATFSVSASGTAPLSYQWRKNTTNVNGAMAASSRSDGASDRPSSLIAPATAIARSSSTRLISPRIVSTSRVACESHRVRPDASTSCSSSSLNTSSSRSWRSGPRSRTRFATSARGSRSST